MKNKENTLDKKKEHFYQSTTSIPLRILNNFFLTSTTIFDSQYWNIINSSAQQYSGFKGFLLNGNNQIAYISQGSSNINSTKYLGKFKENYKYQLNLAFCTLQSINTSTAATSTATTTSVIRYPYFVVKIISLENDTDFDMAISNTNQPNIIISAGGQNTIIGRGQTFMTTIYNTLKAGNINIGKSICIIVYQPAINPITGAANVPIILKNLVLTETFVQPTITTTTSTSTSATIQTSTSTSAPIQTSTSTSAPIQTSTSTSAPIQTSTSTSTSTPTQTSTTSKPLTISNIISYDDFNKSTLETPSYIIDNWNSKGCSLITYNNNNVLKGVYVNEKLTSYLMKGSFNSTDGGYIGYFKRNTTYKIICDISSFNNSTTTTSNSLNVGLAIYIGNDYKNGVARLSTFLSKTLVSPNVYEFIQTTEDNDSFKTKPIYIKIFQKKKNDNITQNTPFIINKVSLIEISNNTTTTKLASNITTISKQTTTSNPNMINLIKNGNFAENTSNTPTRIINNWSGYNYILIKYNELVDNKQEITKGLFINGTKPSLIQQGSLNPKNIDFIGLIKDNTVYNLSCKIDTYPYYDEQSLPIDAELLFFYGNGIINGKYNLSLIGKIQITKKGYYEKEFIIPSNISYINKPIFIIFKQIVNYKNRIPIIIKYINLYESKLLNAPTRQINNNNIKELIINGNFSNNLNNWIFLNSRVLSPGNILVDKLYNSFIIQGDYKVTSNTYLGLYKAGVTYDFSCNIDNYNNNTSISTSTSTTNNLSKLNVEIGLYYINQMSNGVLILVTIDKRIINKTGISSITTTIPINSKAIDKSIVIRIKQTKPEEGNYYNLPFIVKSASLIEKPPVFSTNNNTK